MCANCDAAFRCRERSELVVSRPLLRGGRMRRREFIALVGSAVACPRAARAQQSGTVNLPKIGFLLAGRPDDCGPTCTAWRPPNTGGVSAPNPLMAGIFTELQRLGWVDGRNAIYE